MKLLNEISCFLGSASGSPATETRQEVQKLSDTSHFVSRCLKCNQWMLDFVQGHFVNMYA